MNYKNNFKNSAGNIYSEKGATIITALIFGSIAIVIITGLVGWFGGLIRSSQALLDREKAFQIAEAGVDYYRWHLAHAPQDFTNGTTTAQPYVTKYYDKDGVAIGEYSLNITAPATGSTLVTIESTGKVYSNPNISRKIRTKLAIPSFAKYATAANEVMRFGDDTEVYGPIHSNNGIRFDGIAHNVISSAVSSYDDPDHTGGVEFGVHTHVNVPPATGINENYRPAEAPSSAVVDRTDVFQSGRTFPTPAIDFNGITSDLANLKTKAQSGGRYFAPSGALGYHIVLKNNDTFDLYRVTRLVSVNGACANRNDQDDWGTWSINTETFVSNYANPTNGVIFVEDDAWVNGIVNTARVTIAAAKFPDNANDRKNITVNNDLLYTNKDGRDSIALIAQNNINVGMVSEDFLEIDAALIAQNGRVGRFLYRLSQCNPYDERDTITLYGMIGTNQRYGFAYTDGSGYAHRNIIYDTNLLYSPPPEFPLTSDQYVIVSWEEIK